MPVTSTAPPSTTAGAGWRLSPMGMVWLAGGVYGVLQLVTVGLQRPWRWDEVVYLAQVTPGAAEVWFGPQRAIGMLLVVAPPAWLGAALPLVRGWMLAVSVAALVLAFRPWARNAGWVGGAAALVAATGWLPLYFGTELYPNLLVGFAAVGTTGHLAAWTQHRRHGDLVGVALGLMAVALLRPTESVWLAAALAPVALVLGGRQRWHPIAALAAGGVLGWMPWVVESFVRFGGPFARLQAAAGSSVGAQQRNQVVQYLALVEGPVRRVSIEPVLTVRGLVWLLTMLALILLGVLAGDRDRRHAALMGGWVGIGLLVPYLVLAANVNLRYVTPALLVLSVPVAAGLVTLAAAVRRSGSRALAALLTVAVVTGIGWQVALAAANARDAADDQGRAVVLADALRQAADGEECAFVSRNHWPEIQWYSGCLGAALVAESPTLQCADGEAHRDIGSEADRGARVFVIERGDPPDVLREWPATRVPDVAPGTWQIYTRPDGLGSDAPPRLGDPDTTPSPCPPSSAPDASQARLELRWDQPGS